MTLFGGRSVKRKAGRGFGRSGSLLDTALVVVLMGAVPIGLGLYVYDHVTRTAARARAEKVWVQVQPAMVRRLNQGAALEYGAVWATHSGVVCGLVNGWGSFGGLSGMTPFYVWHGRPVFSPDVSAIDFSGGWRDCMGDPWIELRKGSMETGWCATRQGAKTCKLVEG